MPLLGLVGAFSVIVKTDCETDGALHSTNSYRGDHGAEGRVSVWTLPRPATPALYTRPRPQLNFGEMLRKPLQVSQVSQVWGGLVIRDNGPISSAAVRWLAATGYLLNTGYI